MTSPRTPGPLLLALETLEDLGDTVRVIDGWRLVAGDFACHLRLTLDGEPSIFVPKESDWYAVAEPDYPRGDLTLYPAKHLGLTATFPHQTYNGAGQGKELGALPWRPGNPCLTHPLAALGDRTVWEPRDAASRLAWQVRRLRHWLNTAAQGCLQSPGEPFELPQPPDHAERQDIVFVEGRDSLDIWQAIAPRQGLLDLRPYGRRAGIFRPDVFSDEEGREVRRLPWNDLPGKAKEGPLTGLWMRLDRVPVEAPWRLPQNWEELYSACLGAATDLNQLLERQSQRFRDGKRHPLLIGYPIPEKVGGPAERLHWSAILMPVLSDKKSASKKGFSAKSLLDCDRHHIRHGKIPLEWVRTANWAEDQLRSRGTLPFEIQDVRIALIGAGALGGMVAELLARAGARITAIFDPDTLVGGNTCRHVLTLKEVGLGKAAALAERLNAIQPLHHCQGFASAFPPRDKTARTLLDDAQLILECTGEDDILTDLAAYPWPRGRNFISLSTGWKARRLYAFGSRGALFPEDGYREAYSPWRSTEDEERGQDDMPWEGIGCWHPVFPARADDIALNAALGVKFIESFLSGDGEDRFETYSANPQSSRQDLRLP